ncbi:1,4-alpha-glucan branching protein domain-containing protein [Desmospora profundinema]|uniref:1,4-alpha-glucan branching enzyme n=1 Tax=Desmospora profundinema TaxID=1571184 RepID=A0ABU1IJ22_9BACL|nr:1,4-alpha-glucan branching protein domain-containing protein [Desmospora profundinema]MDR6224753.1 1,4-alpha-glucan branching enzyme [Desmospora profundinema]
MSTGSIALILHAHLPYVRHPEQKDVLEERWLHEAVVECYIPLFMMFEELHRDEVDFRLALSLSPPLAAMLADPLLQKRTADHLERLVQLADREVERTKGDDSFLPLALMYRDRFHRVRDYYQRVQQNLLTPLCRLEEAGRLELFTAVGTHPFLPYLLREETIRAHIQAAVTSHEQLLGRRPRGIWLPECGFVPGVDPLLREAGIQWFCVDSHAFDAARPTPPFETDSPVLTPAGIAAFARDSRSSEQVWSSQTGYPGDYDYREYYRDIGYDLDWETIGPFVHPDGIRVHTGFKYYRITGYGEHKEPYNPDWAREKAARHARHFLDERRKQVREAKRRMGRDPVVTAPFDAELFGHWWFEGPVFLELLFRQMHFDQDEVKPITPSQYLSRYTDFPVCELSMSSWGRHGYGDVWLQGANEWIYPVLHRAEERMNDLVHRAERSSPEVQRALVQAGRELMLAQASDWAFIMDNRTMVDYALKRTKQHVARFDKLAAMVESKEVDPVYLGQVEELDSLFPDLEPAWFRSPWRSGRALREERPTVLMLAWEYPPMTVGGLSRHVYDLSRHLVRLGWSVHVVTTEVPGYPHTETVKGVEIHRAHVMKPFGNQFYHWVFQLNRMLLDTCRTLIRAGHRFDVVHAHDWLVSVAARGLKKEFGLPVTTTIHATEHGRNQGIHTDLQRRIHRLERDLIEESSRVIVCSRHMEWEVREGFQLPSIPLRVIPNGVDPVMLKLPFTTADCSPEPFAREGERMILFIGRLVREKGVETLLEAAKTVVEHHPDTKWIIAGKGPMRTEWEEQAHRMGLKEKTLFTGFVSDEDRNRLLGLAEVTVFPSWYEPFGIVALEAMSAGTPVVVSDTGGLKDVVEHDRTGLKAYPGDAPSLALQIRTLLENPEQARRLAATAREEISRFDWSHIAGETAAVYEEMFTPEENQVRKEIAAHRESRKGKNEGS